MNYHPTPGATGSRGPVWVALLGYLAFVVYGSLVPFEVQHLGWDQAVMQFRRIPYLELGVVGRADWVANIVLYVPLAFLGCSALLGVRRARWWTLPGLVLVAACCVLLAVGVEFTQQWFAPRTVSQNDLIAESIGTLIGILLWVFGRARVAWVLDGIRTGGRVSVLAALLVGGVLYLLLSFFPYDFLLSSDEWRGRFGGGNQGWLLAPACGAPLRCVATLGIEALAVAPLGLLAILWWPRLGLRTLFLVGVLVGLALELLQLLLASGVTQGLSILMRGGGLVLGALAGQLLGQHGPRPAARLVVLAAPFLALPYVAGILLVSGWFRAPAVPAAAALARLSEVRWLPLYYQYFTTESLALTSALAQLALYAPIGLLAWAWAAQRPARRAAGHWLAVGLAVGLALPLSLLVEGGKLFFPPGHPDPTNALLALIAALLAYGSATWFERVLRGAPAGAARPRAPGAWEDEPATGPLPVAPARANAGPVGGWDGPGAREADRATAGAAAVGGDRAAAPTDAPSGHVSSCGSAPIADGPAAVPAAPTGAGAQGAAAAPLVWPAPRRLGIALAVPTALAWLAGVATFPLAWPILATALLLYALLLWFYPLAWLLVVPALLPALDLSPLTGRLPLDAFDLVVLTTLLVGYLRVLGVHRRPWPNRLFPVALGVLWLSWCSAMARGLWPLLGADWPPADASHSPVEAWMVGKGMLWALLLVPLLRRVPPRRLGQARDLVMQGVLLGLALVALAVLWERHVHVGLFDFANEFRVTGTFASMHTGGAYIEAFLAFAFPFLVVTVLGTRPWWQRVVGVLLAALVAYAMMVTFSRGGWAGLAAGSLVVALGMLRGRAGKGTWIAAAVLVVAVAAAAVPVLTGGFAQTRLAGSANDLRIRLAHWERALSLMTPGAASVLLGEGFGQYPQAFLMLAEPARPPGSFAILTEGGNPFLRLGAGESVFLDQLVGIAPGQRYRLALRLRQPGGVRPFEVPVCEKALLYSFACVRVVLTPEGAGNGWVELAADFDSGKLGTGGHWPHPGVKLALPNSGGTVDLDHVSLRAPDGRELIANGDFSQGARRWLFVSDQDLAWHIHEQWVELYFAQGVLGMLALVMLLSAAGLALWRVLRTVSPAGFDLALGLAAGLAGLLTVGLLGSVLDTARLSMLCYLGGLLAAGMFPGEWRRGRHGLGRRSRGSFARLQTDAVLATRSDRIGSCRNADGPDPDQLGE